MTNLTSRIRVTLLFLRHDLDRMAEKALMAVAWRLPRSLVYLCAIRVVAHATTGQWSSQNVPELYAVDALKRWEK